MNGKRLKDTDRLVDLDFAHQVVDATYPEWVQVDEGADSNFVPVFALFSPFSFYCFCGLGMFN